MPNHPIVGRGSTSRYLLGLVLAGIIASVLVAGCGSDDSDSGGGSTAAGDTTAASGGDTEANAVLDKYFKGVVDEPPATGPKAVADKTIQFNGAMAFEAHQKLADALKEAGAELGWKVDVVDNKGDPTIAIRLLKQAAVSGVDGVVISPFDCPVIKSGLEVAKQAKMSVVNYGGLDCDYPDFGGGEPLFAAPLKLNGTENFGDLYEKFGRADAEFMLAGLKVNGVDAPNMIVNQSGDIGLEGRLSKGFTSVIDEQCPDCTLNPLKFTFAQVATGKAPQVFKTGMLRYPTADSLFFNYDGQLSLGGLAGAIRGAKQDFKLICCGDGLASGLELIRTRPAGTVAEQKYPYEWYSWAAADELNRLFSGQTVEELPDEGGVIFFVNKDHNLPASGTDVEYPFDYKAAYSKVWKGS